MYIIDTIAPFFPPERFSGNPVVNWSKAPFSWLEKQDSIPAETGNRIVERFDCFAKRAADIGYNAVSIDDLAHMVVLDTYPQKFRNKIAAYQDLYDRIFRLAGSLGLAVFVTTDTGFSHGGKPVDAQESIDRMVTACIGLFRRFSDVAGIIVRIGECDGVDVEGEVKSSLCIRTHSDARMLIESLVALFETFNRTLVVRTWTVGAHSVGDLIWNRESYRKIFSGIASDNLIVSHKYGNTDFFRYLQLNPLIFEGEQRKMVEFQARREYEGFGEFPSFIGHDYEKFRDELAGHPNLAGIIVWCQTGGWGRFNRLSFLSTSSLWNEINTAVTLSLFKSPVTAEQAVDDFCARFLPWTNAKAMLRMLKLSDLVIKRLWYLPEFSKKTLFFRRTRIPPLLWVFWDTIIIHPALRRLVRLQVKNRFQAVREGYHILEHIKEMKQIAGTQCLDTDDFDFQYDTFEILAMCREYFLGNGYIAIRCKIKDRISAYRKKYPDGFFITCDFSRSPIDKHLFNLVAKTIIRKKSGYRMIDTALFNPGAQFFYLIFKLFKRRQSTIFNQKRSMGIDALLK